MFGGAESKKSNNPYPGAYDVTHPPPINLFLLFITAILHPLTASQLVKAAPAARQLAQPVAQATKNFSTQLQAILATQKADIQSAFAQSDRYESDYNELLNEDDAYTDLYSFAYEIERQFPSQSALVAAAQAVRTAINEAVVKKAYHSGICWFCDDRWEWKNYGGLGIYLPLGWDEERRRFYTSNHLMWAYETTWNEFLTGYHQQPVFVADFYPGKIQPLTARTRRPLLTCVQTTDKTCQELARPLPLPEASIYLPLIAR